MGANGMNEFASAVIAKVLTALKENNVPLDKIVIHKFFYFLRTQKMCTEFGFEPYTYGPFSFDLASQLRKMAFWDEIDESKNKIEIKDLSAYRDVKLDNEEKIYSLLIKFKEIIADFNFRSLECAGTILYCAETISYGNEKQKPTFAEIEKEFIAWKGNKYSSEEIKTMYTRLQSYIN